MKRLVQCRIIVSGNFAISDQDTLHMVSGYLNLEGSSNGGLNFVEINRWDEPDDTALMLTYELQNVLMVFYIGTDGYLSRSYDNGATWGDQIMGPECENFIELESANPIVTYI